MRSIPSWQPKFCNSDRIGVLGGSDSLVAWISLPLPHPLGGHTDGLKDVIGAMALEGIFDLRRVCLHATMRTSSVLFLGEWDASLSLECGRWTLEELSTMRDLGQIHCKRRARNTLADTQFKRQWNGREWTWQMCRHCAELEFAKAVSRCASLQEAADMVQNDSYKVGMSASYMWYVTGTMHRL